MVVKPPLIDGSLLWSMVPTFLYCSFPAETLIAVGCKFGGRSGVENRCIVPVTEFAEPDPASKPEGARTPNAWFALNEDKPLFWFAGIWVPQWTSVRKIKTGLETIDLFGFLTTSPNRVVGEVHEKAMPVVLRNDLEIDLWLTKPWSDVKHLQRPLPDDELVRLESVPKAA